VSIRIVPAVKPRSFYHRVARVSGERFMTCCVAAICGDGKALVLVADKMIGVGYVEGEPDIEKLQRLHPRWWVMIAGDDVAPAFPIIDRAKELLGDGPVNVDSVTDAMKIAYDQQRTKEAESVYLKPRDWKMERFNREGSQILSDYRELAAKISEYELSVKFIIAGFNRDGKAYILSIDGDDKRAEPRRHDIPGFCAIGSGAIGAVYMMFYRDLSPDLKARQALYHVLEAKYFGEQASGVGPRTDMYIARPQATVATASGDEAEPTVTKVNDDEVIEKRLIKMCKRLLEPRDLTEKDITTLNELPELGDLPKLEWKKKDAKKQSAPA